MDDLTKDEIEIVLAQRRIRELGYQWEEHVFNDGFGPGADCSVDFTKEKNPNYFTDDRLGLIGWGRFSRIRCWQSALSHMENIASKGERHETNT